jgi:hypothetical protein
VAEVAARRPEQAAAAWQQAADEHRARRPVPASQAGARDLVERNKDAARAFGVSASPTFLWADANGRPRGVSGSGKTEMIVSHVGRRAGAGGSAP